MQVIKPAMKILKVDRAPVTAKTIQSRISHAKNHGKTPQNSRLMNHGSRLGNITANVFAEYDKRVMKKLVALDFDQDLLIKTVELFDKFPQVAENATALVFRTSWSTKVRTRTGSSIALYAI